MLLKMVIYIVDFLIKMVMLNSHVSLPEGLSWFITPSNYLAESPHVQHKLYDFE